MYLLYYWSQTYGAKQSAKCVEAFAVTEFHKI